jgi:hypothetical protein
LGLLKNFNGQTIEATFRELLDIDGNQEAGILPMQVPANETKLEVVNATN